MSALRKYGLSLLDEEQTPIGLDAQANRDLAVRQVKNEKQERDRFQRVGRRAYRQGMKTGNYGMAMQGLEFSQKHTGSTGAGIGVAGQDERGLTQQQGFMKQKMDALSGQGTANAPANGSVGLPVPGAPSSTSFRPATTPGAIASRIDLHNQMRDAVQTGGDLSGLRSAASAMGIDDAGWQRGMAKLPVPGAPQGGALVNQTAAITPPIPGQPAAAFPSQYGGNEPGFDFKPQTAAELYKASTGNDMPGQPIANQFTGGISVPGGGQPQLVGPPAPSLVEQASALRDISNLLPKSNSAPSAFAALTVDPNAGPSPLGQAYNQAIPTPGSLPANDPLMRGLNKPAAPSPYVGPPQPPRHTASATDPQTKQIQGEASAKKRAEEFKKAKSKTDQPTPDWAKDSILGRFMEALSR